MTHMYMHTCRNSHILSLIHNYTLIHLEILALALIHFPLTLTLTATLFPFTLSTLQDTQNMGEI